LSSSSLGRVPLRQIGVEQLVVLGLAALLTIATVMPSGPVRTAVVLPLALFLPGYALSLAIFGNLRDWAATAGISCFLSIAVYAFDGLLLHALSYRLTTHSIVVTVDAVVIACVATNIATTRHASLQLRPKAVVTRATYVTAFLAVAALAASAAVVTQRALPKPASAPFTEFAFAGRWSHVTTVISPTSSRLRVALTLHNQTGQKQLYRIAPVLAGRPWASRRVGLEAGERWTGLIEGPVLARPCLQRLRVALDTSPKVRITTLALEIRGRASACGWE